MSSSDLTKAVEAFLSEFYSNKEAIFHVHGCKIFFHPDKKETDHEGGGFVNGINPMGETDISVYQTKSHQYNAEQIINWVTHWIEDRQHGFQKEPLTENFFLQ